MTSELTGDLTNLERSNVAAVDIGSNSFHMVIARLSGRDVEVLDRARDSVRLAAGLDAAGNLQPDAQERAIECLERFGQRLRNLDPSRIRAVGTNTLRRARGDRLFRARADRALGHRIEVISGEEEARLIYLGVAHTDHSDLTHRLVVDIGGGSTELIVGERFEVLRAHSLFMGCVTWSQRFFADGAIRRDAFKSADTAAMLELQGVAAGLKGLGWEGAVGASGTIGSVADLVKLNQLDPSAPAGAITLPGLKRLRKLMVAAGHVGRLSLPGLRPERAEVLPGGLAILIAIFKRLDIASMTVAAGALREGVIYDLLGRIHHEDVRDRTIRRLLEQYHVDLLQAAHVERTAVGLLEQVEPKATIDGLSSRKLLEWAARLHELGLMVAHSGYHKHGAYLAANAHMPGFSADDQVMLAALIRCHRRRLTLESFALLPLERQGAILRLTVILRLAVLLNRGRVGSVAPRFEFVADSGALTLTFPAGWLASHPLTRADLEEEAGTLRPLGLALTVQEAGRRPELDPRQTSGG